MKNEKIQITEGTKGDFLCHLEATNSILRLDDKQQKLLTCSLLHSYCLGLFHSTGNDLKTEQGQLILWSFIQIIAENYELINPRVKGFGEKDLPAVEQ